VTRAAISRRPRPWPRTGDEDAWNVSTKGRILTMRNRSKAILLAATTALGVVGLGRTASAAPATYEQPIVSSVSATVLASSANGEFALAQAQYRCYGGDVGTHLFIAVKQGPDVTPENPSSSETTTAFYSTNWGTDGPSLTVTATARPTPGRSG
jgi:hypothetical protein